MRFFLGLAAAALFAVPAFALSSAAKEFMAIAKELEPVHCEKRKLRREILLAHAERRDAAALQRRFDELDRDARIARLEKRLAALEPRVRASGDPQDLAAISNQHREAFYRCE